MRLQTASDVTTRAQLQLTYQTYASTTGANAFMGDLVNASGAFLRFNQGIKENCAVCAGLPYGNPTVWTFRNRT